MKQIEFYEKISQYRYQFYITAYALLRNEADAEDAVCNAILNGYEHLVQLKNPKKFKAWMLTIVKNEALKICNRRVELPGDENVENMLPPAYDSHNELWDVVQALKEEYRIVIVLFYFSAGYFRCAGYLHRNGEITPGSWKETFEGSFG